MHTILFDLDGTLTDPKLGITRSIQHALGSLGQDVPTQEELTWCIGPPLLGSLRKLIGSQTQAENALLLFRERFGETGMYENEVYPGIPAALSSLKAAGHKLFVATSKPTVYAIPILEHFQLSQNFDAIHGSELNGTRSDKSELLAWMTVREGLDPGMTVMVGDRSHDVVGGQNNGMMTLGVLYGYGTRQELLNAGADNLCNSPVDLARLLC